MTRLRIAAEQYVAPQQLLEVEKAFDRRLSRTS
jgi:hypothetical protein